MSYKRVIWRFLRRTISLRGGTDVEGTIEEISKNVEFRGINIWMLVCSAILASIGLDINSTAVIIGAMLISPLMSPILGVGLAVAIQDRQLLKAATKNLGLATFLSLGTSFVYFFISPLGELTAELNARITPTILDVGVAFFGGVAGIAAGSRRDKTNAIPGVAIATALMPPICTAGYGLAKMSSTVFLGASYLYFINAVVIALATYLLALWLRFPKRAQIDEEEKITVRRFIISFVILVIFPSSFIFYNVLSKLRFDKGVQSFVNTEVRKDERQPVRWEVLDADLSKTLKVYTVGRAAGKNEKDEMQKALDKYGIGNLKLEIIQLNVSPDEFEKLTSDVETNVINKLTVLQSVEEESQKQIESLKAELEKVRELTQPNRIFLNDIQRLFPEIESVSWQEPTTGTPPETSNQTKTLLITFKTATTTAGRNLIKARIMTLGQNRFNGERFQLVEQIPQEQTNEGNTNTAPQ